MSPKYFIGVKGSPEEAIWGHGKKTLSSLLVISFTKGEVNIRSKRKMSWGQEMK